MGYKFSAPEEIGEKIIYPLRIIAGAAIDRCLPIQISKQIVELSREKYPWNLSEDPKWRGYLLEWNMVLVPILNKSDLIDSSSKTATIRTLCEKIDDERILGLYEEFLKLFSSNKMPRGISEEGIISDRCCLAAAENYKCVPIFSAADLDLVKFPWLRLYDKRLPPIGDYPFVPPADWKKLGIPPKGKSHGYLDAKNVEWVWDNLHKNHWDVQDGSPYKNVTPEGKIL